MKICIITEQRYHAEGFKNLLNIHYPESECFIGSLAIESAELEQFSSQDIIIIDPVDSKLQVREDVLNDLMKIKTNVLVVSSLDEESFVLNCFYRGAKGFLLKTNYLNRFLDAVNRVSKGELFIDQGINRYIIMKLFKQDKSEAKAAPPIRPYKLLSNREWEILESMAQDLTNKEIAKKLFISESTITYYSTTIQKKLKVNSRVGAVVKSINEGWLNIKHFHYSEK
ncbi:LuxR C-terminal-related transcriptional regulator [Sutcliffiella sp. NPDC057660]|uniref:LuxR C-terminal-related transcriptional regulator n=1 Tax=Sutcliffiella sp. NPDC057660 TaxID=3346199 RepID=UPI0036AB1384